MWKIPFFLLACAPWWSLAQEPAPAAGASQPPQESPGEWLPGPPDQAAWLHVPTGLRFPARIDRHQLVGIRDFEGSEDRLVRYESVEDRARGDLFLFPLDPAPKTDEDLSKALDEGLKEAFMQLADMTHAGLYEEVSEVEALSGEIPIWESDPLPMIARVMEATRVEVEEGQTYKTPLYIWYGLTVFEGHLITIRHLRPVDRGEEGEASLKRFIDAVFEILKDPALRQDILPAIDAYMEDPLSELGHESANLILRYLDNSPTVSVLQPRPPFTDWTEATEKLVPGSGSQLLRAYVIAGASASFQNKDLNSAITLAAQQVVRVYLKMKEKAPLVIHPGLEELAAAVERGEGSAWLREQMEKAEANE